MSRVCGHRPGLLLSPSRVNCLWVNGSHLRASSVCVEWGIGDAESPQISWVFVFLLFSTFWWFLFTFFSFFRNAFYSSGFESGIRKFLVFSFFCPLCVLMNVWCFFSRSIAILTVFYIFQELFFYSSGFARYSKHYWRYFYPNSRFFAYKWNIYIYTFLRRRETGRHIL